MGQIGVWQIVLVVALVVLLFGRGKISSLMGDVAQGIKAFKRGMSDEKQDTAKVERQKGETIEGEAVKSKTSSKKKKA